MHITNNMHTIVDNETGQILPISLCEIPINTDMPITASGGQRQVTLRDRLRRNDNSTPTKPNRDLRKFKGCPPLGIKLVKNQDVLAC